MSTLNQRPERFAAVAQPEGRRSRARALDQRLGRSEDEAVATNCRPGNRRSRLRESPRAVGPGCQRSIRRSSAERLGQVRRHAFSGQLVRTDVQFIIRVALDPAPLDLVPLGSRSQGSPKVLVLDWFFGGRPPAVAFPAVDPARDSATQILGICVQDHLRMNGSRSGGLRSPR